MAAFVPALVSVTQDMSSIGAAASLRTARCVVNRAVAVSSKSRPVATNARGVFGSTIKQGSNWSFGPISIQKSFGTPVSRVSLSREFAKNAFVGQTRMQVSKVSEPATKEVGTPETLEYRVFLYGGEEKKLSPWHDIPLYANAAAGTVNFVNEIPKNTRAKMEVATTEEFTPIKQDTKKGALRYYTYGDMLFNYGCLPQTWEDPNAVQEGTGYKGDNDPVDIVELGEATLPIGAVAEVKVLGALGLIDEGEIDWKVLAIRVDDPKAAVLNDIEDVENYLPGTVDTIRKWFREYKVPDGKGENSYAFDGKALGKEYALEVIAHTHQSWKDLKAGKIDPDDLSLV